MESEIFEQPQERQGQAARHAFRLSRPMAWVWATLRCSLRPLGTTSCFFLLPFVKWFGVPSPFAAAGLLAMGGRYAPFSLLGLGASLGLRLLWGLAPDWWQYAGCLSLWLLLLKAKPARGVETAALGGLAMLPRAIWALRAGEPLNILLCLAAIPMAMLCSAWLRLGVEVLDSKGRPGEIRERSALILGALLLVAGLGYFRVWELNLGFCGAVLCMLLAAGSMGCAGGAAAGLFCGLALALGGHDSRIAFSLSLCGLLCGIPFIAKRRWLCVPAALVGDLLAFFVTPLLSPALSFWTVGLGCGLYLLLPAGVREAARELLGGAAASTGETENAFVTERLNHMQEALQQAAQALPQSKELIPTDGEELGALLCAQCANRELCWGRGRGRTEKLLGMMLEMTRRGEAIQEDKLPALSQQGCLRADSIGETAQEALAARQKRRARMSRLQHERELTLTHLAALSDALGELTRVTRGESLNDLQAAHVLKLALSELRVPARLCYARRVEGHLQIALQAEPMVPIQKPLEALLRYLEQTEEISLSIARAEKGHIELEEIPLYSAAIGMASVCAGQRIGSGDPDVCGDAGVARRCEGGRLLLLLCDGMGHGAEAHAQSEKTLELLLLLLQAGYTRRQALTAVNGIMLGAQEQAERFSTVDLADVDLWSGDVCCEKLGACPSWVIRGNHMKKVDTSSLPLGIMEEAKPTAIRCRLHSGDILVMMSDGVTDVFEDDRQLVKVLEESLYIQPQRMADALLRNALLASGGTPKDDMTVLVLLMMDRRRDLQQ